MSLFRANPHRSAPLAWRLLVVVGLPLGWAVAAALVQADTPPQALPVDWAANDVKGQRVDTLSFRGRVLLVFINSPALKGKMKALTQEMILEFGHNRQVAQVTVVDMRDAPLTWRGAETLTGAVTDKMAAIHDWKVDEIQDILKRNGKPPIPGLSRKLHIVLDWEGDLVGRYHTWDTSTTITIAVIGPHGDVLGAFKESQLPKVKAAVAAALARP